MSHKLADCSAIIQVPIPGYPGLALICTDSERYSPEVIHQVVRSLEERLPEHVPTAVSPPVIISSAQIKALLRAIHTPQVLAEHPVAVMLADKLPGLRGEYLAHLLRAAVNDLEKPDDSASPDIRGSILRMRFLERQRAKTVMRRLHLSASHFYRLQREGLRRLAERLADDLRRRSG